MARCKGEPKYRRLGWLGLAALFLGLLLAGCAPAESCAAAPTPGAALRVLFIGNSYTQVNDLPQIFTRLACSGRRVVQTGLAAGGGWTLEQHAAAAQTLQKLQSQPWDLVILQEQSEIPAFEQNRRVSMYPAARQLVAKIRAQGANPLFLVTWAHRSGAPEYGIPNYAEMQARINAGYLGIAGELGVLTVPVGEAWSRVRGQPGAPELWDQDGSHPSPAGTYLAACVLYATIYRQSPLGLTFTAGLPPETARLLQSTAAAVAY